MKILNNIFYFRHVNELNKYITGSKKSLLISKIELERYNKFNKEVDKVIISDINNLILRKKKYDLIIISDLLENSEDLYNFLHKLLENLTSDGKLVISSINSRWLLINYFLEFFNLKNKSQIKTPPKAKNIISNAKTSNLDLVQKNTRQFIPFKFLYFGSFINSFLEILFFKFHLGIRSYLVFKNSTSSKTIYSKTIIIPAKNEAQNLPILFDRLPSIQPNPEIIIACGKSTDNTLEVAKKIKINRKDLKIKIIEQTGNGKANAVYEAINSSQNDVIAIFDSDISVDPETLPTFFNLIDENKADFVNGTRMVYKMEVGAMRQLNKIGNIVFQFLIKQVIRIPLTDSLCGTKIFKRKSFYSLVEWQKKMRVKDPFGDFDLIFNSAYIGDKFIELPVHYKSRIYGETQISRFKDGYKLIVYFLRSFLIFNTSFYNSKFDKNHS